MQGTRKGLIFSNKCKSFLSGPVNKQNCRIWRSERSNVVYERLQNSRSIMVRCASSKMEIKRPYFFEDSNVTGIRYKRMGLYFLVPKLREFLDSMIFQQGGAPPHYANEVREYLDGKLPRRWMERSGLISWPARSPDLTFCEYYLWGHIKGFVYRDHPQTISEFIPGRKRRNSLGSFQEHGNSSEICYT